MNIPPSPSKGSAALFVGTSIFGTRNKEMLKFRYANLSCTEIEIMKKLM
jgi:hypothetical protein